MFIKSTGTPVKIKPKRENPKIGQLTNEFLIDIKSTDPKVHDQYEDMDSECLVSFFNSLPYCERFIFPMVQTMIYRRAYSATKAKEEVLLCKVTANNRRNDTEPDH